MALIAAPPIIHVEKVKETVTRILSVRETLYVEMTTARLHLGSQKVLIAVLKVILRK